MKRVLTLIAFALCMIVATTSCSDKPKEKKAVETTAENTVEEKDDPCPLILDQLYNNYVFNNNNEGFSQVIDELLTAKGKQKITGDYDFYGFPYMIWQLKTNTKEGNGESKVMQITPMGNNKYIVKYSDRSCIGETMFVFIEENGKMKIDDFEKVSDQSSDENASYMESNESLSVPSWVIGKWEYDKNEVIEFMPTKFIYTVDGKVVDEGQYDVDGDFIYTQGKNNVCQVGFVMMGQALYFEGGDDIPLKKLSGGSSDTSKNLSKEFGQTPKVISTEEIIENGQKIIKATFDDGVEMRFLVSNDAPGEVTIQRCNHVSEHMIIPSQIMSEGTVYNTTSIGEFAFSDSRMISVTIPNSVKNIGTAAFKECRNLTSVTIPNSMTSIGDGAFYKCESLASVTIPNSVTSIGEDAFSSTSLTSITIPSSVTSIGDNAFADCKSLTFVNIQNPKMSSSLDYESVFNNCKNLNPANVKYGL